MFLRPFPISKIKWGWKTIFCPLVFEVWSPIKCPMRKHYHQCQQRRQQQTHCDHHLSIVPMQLPHWIHHRSMLLRWMIAVPDLPHWSIIKTRAGQRCEVDLPRQMHHPRNHEVINMKKIDKPFPSLSSDNEKVGDIDRDNENDVEPGFSLEMGEAMISP